MLVIAKKNQDTYICELSHTELEKFMDLYYNHLKYLDVGQEFNLGEGHDFHRDTLDALKKTQEFIKSNEKIIHTILNGVSLVGRIRKS